MTPKIYKFNTNVVPDPTVPVIYKDRGQPWFRYGSDNLYPQYITELYNKSAINRRCLQSKFLGVFGNGLKTIDPNQEIALERANDNESWNDVFEKVVLDYEIYSGFALNIVWNATGDKIESFYHIQFQDVRSGDFDLKSDRVEKYYYSSDWNKYKIHKPIQYQAFDPAKAIELPTQILYFMDYQPGSRFYPLPSYAGGCSDIQIDIEVSTFHLSNLANGLSPSLWINFNNGVPDSNAQQDLYQEIASAYSGVENAGKFFATFSESKENSPEITPLPSANDDYYVNLETRITTRILSSHGITSPMLLGLYHEGSGGLGSNKDEIMVAYEHFKNTVLRPDIKAVIKPFDKLMKYSGYTTKLYVEPLALFDKTVETAIV